MVKKISAESTHGQYKNKIEHVISFVKKYYDDQIVGNTLKLSMLPKVVFAFLSYISKTYIRRKRAGKKTTSKKKSSFKALGCKNLSILLNATKPNLAKSTSVITLKAATTITG